MRPVQLTLLLMSSVQVNLLGKCHVQVALLVVGPVKSKFTGDVFCTSDVTGYMSCTLNM